MNIFKTYVLRNLKNNRVRTIMTIAGIMLSVALVTAVIEGGFSGLEYLRNIMKETYGNHHGYAFNLDLDNLITGIANSTLPILMYLLTMCFSTLLEQLSLSSYLADVLNSVKGVGPLMPAFIFVASVLLTIALGSSWSMYAIVFPLAMSFAYAMGLSPALCIGAISGAGIAGEKICMFTADALNVGTSIGCNPDVICKIRVRYSIAISGIAFVLYLIAGFIF